MFARTKEGAGALLQVDLGAVCDNWRLLRGRLQGAARCAAVVKADAYGLGAVRVAPALARAGCRHFFVAHLDEAYELRSCLPPEALLYVLHGPMPGSEEDFVHLGVIPVLNSLGQVDAWRRLATRGGRTLPALLQVDTGMSRAGLSPEELDRVVADPDRLDGIELLYVMSHLACAEDQPNPANAAQRARFAEARNRLPAAPASLANSSGIFLGPDYHFDLVRPGAALYGVAPVAGAPNPMRQVIRLQGKVLQVRAIDTGTPVGYGGTWVAPAPARIATVAVGYADGYLRSQSNRAVARLDGVELPLVGNVSMDLITLDVTALPESAVHPGTLVDLVSPELDVDAVAGRAGTIGYEILTSLGRRYFRTYAGA